MTAAVRHAAWLLLRLWGLALLAALPAAAQASHVELIDRGCKIATSPATTADELLSRAPGAPCPAPPPPHHRGTVWIDIADPDFITDNSIPWRLLIDNDRVRTIDLVVVRADGSRETSRYDTAAPDRSWASGSYFSMSVMPAKAPVTRLMLRFGEVENMSIIRTIKVMSWREGIQSDRRNAALFGIAVGILFITILFHLTLFFAIRRRFQLLYCLSVGVMLVYALVYSGLVMLAVPISGSTLARLLGFAMTAACAAGIAFMIDFVERAALPKWLQRYGAVTVGASAAVAIALLVVPMRLTTPFYLLSNAVGAHSIALIVVMLGVAMRRGSRTARVLALAWSIPLGVAALYPLRASGYVGNFDIPDGTLLFAMTLECMILSLPVTDRIKKLRIDHERARERQHVLERQARTDALTGLANRHGFVDAIERAFATGAHDAALLMIDIDHFKQFNDRFGHGHGDMVLRDVGEHIAKTAGAGAIVARFGGEEFVVALRGHDLRRAATIAERIRMGMSEIGDGTLAPAGPVTVSIGVACGRSDAINALIDEADAALYTAKRRGRDCVVAVGAEGEGVAAAA